MSSEGQTGLPLAVAETLAAKLVERLSPAWRASRSRAAFGGARKR